MQEHDAAQCARFEARLWNILRIHRASAPYPVQMIDAIVSAARETFADDKPARQAERRAILEELR